jgi:hypothetical protein
MLSRNERGKLALNTLDLQVLFDGLLDQCQTGKEIEWVTENITSALEGSAQDKRDDLGVTDEDEDQ